MPSNTEEDRRLVNQRIAYFGAVMGLLSLTFFVFTGLLGVALNPDWKRHLLEPPRLLHLGAASVFGSLWWLCRKGRRSSFQLNVLDVGGLVLTSSLYSLMIAWAPASNFLQSLILTLIVVSTLNTHAVIVPATARRGAWVTALAALPVPITAYYIAARHPGEKLAGYPWAPLVAALFVAMWCVTGIATAALAARIVYGLRERVRAATELGQYTLEEKIGEGGMGTVYRARHALLRRPTAIKLLSTERGEQLQIQRFEREVQLTASLAHPNTIAIYDFGHTPDGVFYYAMEFIEGITLEDLVRHAGPQPAARVAHILSQVCAALVEAHHVGLVHRDIKPANVMLSLRGCVADQVKVLDFGLVKELHSEAVGTTAQNTILGTPLYMAPESITAPALVSARTDLYALGAVGYHLLTGRPVFEGETIVDVCSKHLLAEPVPPSRNGALDVPAGLEQLIMACLSKAPDARPPSAASLRDAISELGLTTRWTPVDAERWWHAEAPKVRQSVQAELRLRSSAPATLAIDLTRRKTDGPARRALLQ